MSDEEESESEKFYNREIAPLLARAGGIAAENGLPFVAQVEYEPDAFGLTVALPAAPSATMKLMHAAATSKGNIDALVIEAAKYGREQGHSSMVLTLLDRKEGTVTGREKAIRSMADSLAGDYHRYHPDDVKFLLGVIDGLRGRNP